MTYVRNAVLLSFFFLSSCSYFPTGRSYLSEMEHDDSSFYSPEEDFPIVAGDNGEFGLSEKERRSRTPASEYDVGQSKDQMALRQELKNLENSQGEYAQENYQKYKANFTSTSEKIYYLRLPHNERNDYLESRGFLESPRDNVITKQEKMMAARSARITLGMSKSDVIGSFGKPLRVDVAGNPSYENERWAYSVYGGTKYIYFESGEVHGWE